MQVYLACSLSFEVAYCEDEGSRAHKGGATGSG